MTRVLGIAAGLALYGAVLVLLALAEHALDDEPSETPRGDVPMPRRNAWHPERWEA